MGPGNGVGSPESPSHCKFNVKRLRSGFKAINVIYTRCVL